MGYEVFIRPHVIIACSVLTPVYTATGTGLEREIPLRSGEVERPLRNMAPRQAVVAHGCW